VVGPNGLTDFDALRRRGSGDVAVLYAFDLLELVDPFTFSAASHLDIVAVAIRPALKLSLGFFFPANRPRPTLVNSFVKATRLAVAATG
jgi:hypothetical protein